MIASIPRPQSIISYHLRSLKPNFLQLVTTWQMNKTVVGVTFNSLWNPELVCGNTTTTKYAVILKVYFI